MNKDLEYDIKEFLKTHLSLEVKTESNYNGGMNDGPMYTDSHTVLLLLDGEVISEVSL